MLVFTTRFLTIWNLIKWPWLATKPSEGSSRSSLWLQDMAAKGGNNNDEISLVRQGGVYVVDGLHPVAAKITAKISRWEFIEMYELLPEFWTKKKKTGVSLKS